MDRELAELFEQYQELLKRFRASHYIKTIQERLYEIGDYFLNQSGGFLGGLFTSRGKGVKVMDYLVTEFSRSDLADDAQMAVADYYFETGEYLDAADYYSLLIKEYPRSEWVEKATYRLGVSYETNSRGYSYDRETLLKGLAAARSYVNRYPDGSYIEEARSLLATLLDGLAKKELEIALFYWNQENAFGTRIHLANLLILFPDTEAAETGRAIMEEEEWDTSVNSVDRVVPKASMDFLDAGGR